MYFKPKSWAKVFDFPNFHRHSLENGRVGLKGFSLVWFLKKKLFVFLSVLFLRWDVNSVKLSLYAESKCFLLIDEVRGEFPFSNKSSPVRICSMYKSLISYRSTTNEKYKTRIHFSLNVYYTIA